MTKTALKATLSEKQIIARDSKDIKNDDVLIAVWTLVDCNRVESAIEINLYKCKNFACRVYINVNEYKDVHLIGIARGATKYQALELALKRIGITFDPPFSSINQDYHFSTPIDSATNAIADALGIQKDKRLVVRTEFDNIHPC